MINLSIPTNTHFMTSQRLGSISIDRLLLMADEADPIIHALCERIRSLTDENEIACLQESVRELEDALEDANSQIVDLKSQLDRVQAESDYFSDMVVTDIEDEFNEH